MARSSGVVMKPRTRSALAPMYAVRTVTVALSSFGYWRTLSVRTACSPAMMMTRLTTMASTGRRMKMSVSFTAAPQRFTGCGESCGSCFTLLFTTTLEPLRSLNAPALTSS